jgi:peptide/nickel transport system permease protein
VLFYLSAGWLTLIILLAVFAGALPIAAYSEPIAGGRLGPSFSSLDLLLGTDTLGRSVLSRLIFGAQVSLVVGAVAATTGLVIGALFGLLSGYFRGKVDGVTALLVDAMLAFPPLILLLALASVLTPSVRTLLIGLSLLSVPAFVRLARGATISVSSREFVRAAVNIGATNRRIITRELLPNIVGPMVAYLPVVMAAMIVAEGSLSFLGLGIPPPQPSWGGMISDGKDALARAPHMVVMPAVAVFFTVFSLNQLGDHLRLKFDRSAH